MSDRGDLQQLVACGTNAPAKPRGAAAKTCRSALHPKTKAGSARRQLKRDAACRPNERRLVLPGR